jgi:hypothetical protein
VVLAPTVALIEALGPPVAADLGDGFAASQPVRIAESVKGAPAPGAELVLRLPDGVGLPAGEQRLAFLSNGAYRHRALSRGLPPAPDPRIAIEVAPARAIASSAIAELRTRAERLAAIERDAGQGLPDTPRRLLWLLDTADGRDADPATFWLHASGAEAAGGRDGCNWWGRDPGVGGAIVSSLIGCPNDPVRTAYQEVLMGRAPAQGALQPDGSLRFEGAGHLLVFRRPLD